MNAIPYTRARNHLTEIMEGPYEKYSHFVFTRICKNLPETPFDLDGMSDTLPFLE